MQLCDLKSRLVWRRAFAATAALAAMLSVAAAPNADAQSITYDFTVTATSGPLTGDVADGSFTYDASSIVAGGFNSAAGLFTSLTFTWGGETFDAATANTGFLDFDNQGNLTRAFFGTDCSGGDCETGPFLGPNNWDIVLDPGSIINGLTYSFDGGSLGFGTVTGELAVPEPSTLALFAAPLIGLAALRRRRGAR